MLMESSDHPSPVVSENMIYTQRKGVPLAVDKLTGLTLWKKGYDVGPLDYLISYKDMVIGIGIFGNIFALDKNSGEKKWESYIPITGFKNVQVIDDTLLCVSYGNIIAFDLINKKMIWSFDGPYVTGRPFIADNAVYLGGVQNDNAYLVILDLKTGKVLKKIEIESKSINSVSTPFVTKDKIVVCSNKLVGQDCASRFLGRIFIFDRGTGSLIFKSKEMGAICGEFDGEKNLVFFISSESSSILRSNKNTQSYCNAFDIYTNTLKWKYKIANGMTKNKVKKYNSFILSEEDNKSICLLQSNDGSPLWKFEIGQEMGSDFVLDGDKLYFTTVHSPDYQESILYAIDLKQRRLIWKNSLEAQE